MSTERKEIQTKLSSLQDHLFNTVFVPAFAGRLQAKLASLKVPTGEGLASAAKGEGKVHEEVLGYLKLASAMRHERLAAAAAGALPPAAIKRASVSMAQDEALNKLTAHLVSSVISDAEFMKVASDVLAKIEEKPELLEDEKPAAKADDGLAAGTPAPLEGQAAEGDKSKEKKD